MRIAVTGAAGYVGGWLVKILTERGHEVFSQDIARGARERFDLEDASVRRPWLFDHHPDLVIHLAAKYGRVWGEQGMRETAALNAGMTAELARDCGEAGIRLLYASSSEVYGLAASRSGPVGEDVALRPLNMYGLSKKWGEEACRVYAPDGLAIVRLNMPYGPPATLPAPGTIPHHSGRVGTYGYNALHTMLWLARHDRDITVHRGTERCFTWAPDAIRGLVMVAESGKAGTWNVCRDDDHMSMDDVAKRCVAAVRGSYSKVVVKAPPAGVTLRKRLDDTRLRQLGWIPEISLDEGIPQTLRYVAKFDEDGVYAA